MLSRYWYSKKEWAHKWHYRQVLRPEGSWQRLWHEQVPAEGLQCIQRREQPTGPLPSKSVAFLGFEDSPLLSVPIIRFDGNGQVTKVRILRFICSKEARILPETLSCEWCGGWDLNPRTPAGQGPEPCAFDLAWQPPRGNNSREPA